MFWKNHLIYVEQMLFKDENVSKMHPGFYLFFFYYVH